MEAPFAHRCKEAVWQSHEFIFMPSPYGRSMAMPAAAKLAPLQAGAKKFLFFD
jgi:hypothetical protein